MGIFFRDKTTKVWKIRWDDPPGPNGERRQRTMSCRKLGNTREIAKAELARIETEINQKTYVTQSKKTLSDLLDRWLTDCAPEVHAPTTLEVDRRCIETHIRPALGGMPLQAIQPLDVQDFCSKTLRKRKKLSPKTIRNVISVLRSVLRQGVLWKMIPSNPALGVVLPRVTKSQKRAATETEVGLLLEKIERSRFRMPFLIGLHTGMRSGEIAGLRWEDLAELDFEGRKRHVLYVRRAAAFTKELGAFVKETKTAAGFRAVLIGDELAEELRQHRMKQMRMASDPQCSYVDQGWICPVSTGALMKPRKLGQAFRYLADRLGISLTIHELRHTQVSILASRGVYGQLISDRVGHVNQGVTQMYTHTTVEMQDVAVDVMTSFLAEARAAAAKLSSG